MTAIYLPEYDAIYAAIPLYQRWEHEVKTETVALNNYPVTISTCTYEDKPLAYCIDTGIYACVISASYYDEQLKEGLFIELGEM